MFEIADTNGRIYNKIFPTKKNVGLLLNIRLHLPYCNRSCSTVVSSYLVSMNTTTLYHKVLVSSTLVSMNTTTLYSCQRTIKCLYEYHHTVYCCSSCGPKLVPKMNSYCTGFEGAQIALFGMGRWQYRHHTRVSRTLIETFGGFCCM